MKIVKQNCNCSKELSKKGGNTNFTVVKLIDILLTKVNIANNNTWLHDILWCDMMRGLYHFCNILPQIHTAHSSLENIRQT